MEGSHRWRTAVAVALVIGCLPATAATAAPGDLDPSFGDGGIATAVSASQALQLRPDGRIVLASQGGCGEERGSSIILTQLLPNGTLDPAFGTAGVVCTPVGADDSLWTEDLALQPDGRVIVLAKYRAGSSLPRALLVRYLPDGSLDPEFGQDGRVIQDFAEGNPAPRNSPATGDPQRDDVDEPRKIALQGNGKILVAGRFMTTGTGTTGVLARLLPDGQLDHDFATQGVIFDSAPDSIADVNALLVQPDGRLVLAAQGQWEPKVLRYLANGVPDPTFGADGRIDVRIDPFQEPEALQDLVAQPDGKLVLVGWGEDDETATGLTLGRLLPNGELDPAFAQAGRSLTIVGTADRPGDRESHAYAVALQPDGKIVVRGDARWPAPLPSPVEVDNVLARFDGDGALDPDFGDAGIVRGPDAGAFWMSGDLALQPDGRMIVAGHPGAARLLGDGVYESETGSATADQPPPPGDSPATASTATSGSSGASPGATATSAQSPPGGVDEIGTAEPMARLDDPGSQARIRVGSTPNVRRIALVLDRARAIRMSRRGSIVLRAHCVGARPCVGRFRLLDRAGGVVGRSARLALRPLAMTRVRLDLTSSARHRLSAGRRIRVSAQFAGIGESHATKLATLALRPAPPSGSRT